MTRERVARRQGAKETESTLSPRLPLSLSQDMRGTQDDNLFR